MKVMGRAAWAPARLTVRAMNPPAPTARAERRETVMSVLMVLSGSSGR